MIFTNKEKFENFLAENAKSFYNIEAYYNDLERGIEECGWTSYEIKSFETKSGHPEVIYYSIKRTFLLNNKWISEEEYNLGEYDDFDECEIEVIF